MKALLRYHRFKLCLIVMASIVLCSCNERRRDLTGRVELLEYNVINDSIDFYITNITLFCVERDVDVVIDDLGPSINIELLITNNTKSDILFRRRDGYNSRFIGITPSMGGDTIYFVNGFDRTKLIPREQKIDFVASSSYPIFKFIDESKYDNTEPILNLIKDMQFYYIPLPADELDVGQDTIALNNQYRIRVDANTKVTSHSIIR